MIKFSIRKTLVVSATALSLTSAFAIRSFADEASPDKISSDKPLMEEDSAASKNCTELGGQIETYRLGPDKVSLCRFGKAALGEWTLLNYTVEAVQKFLLHPERKEGESVPLFMPPPGENGERKPPELAEGFRTNSRLEFNPAFQYCTQLGGEHHYLRDLSAPSDAPTVSPTAVESPRPNPVSATAPVLEGDGSVSPALLAEIVARANARKTLPENGAVGLGPSTEAVPAITVGATTYNRNYFPMKRHGITVCLFPDSSAIEIWTLFHGPGEERNAQLTKVLQGVEDL